MLQTRASNLGLPSGNGDIFISRSVALADHWNCDFAILISLIMPLIRISNVMTDSCRDVDAEGFAADQGAFIFTCQVICVAFAEHLLPPVTSLLLDAKNKESKKKNVFGLID